MANGFGETATTKPVQHRMPRQLLAALDKLSQERKRTRSALINDALNAYLINETDSEMKAIRKLLAKNLMYLKLSHEQHQRETEEKMRHGSVR